MKGLMMDFPLTLPTILRRAESLFGNKEIITRLPDRGIHRYTYKDMAVRSKRLAEALRGLGIREGNRVATHCWNHYRHLECYFGIPGMGAVIHTLNIRLSPGDLSYITTHAEDKALIVDQVLLPVLEKFISGTGIAHVIVIPQTGEPVPDGYLDYEELLSGGDADSFVPFDGDERTAACLCYTSGTTGRPKGVLYSHRSLVLHAMAFMIGSSGVGLTERDVVLPIVPMFHACAWGFPFSCTFTGATQVLPGPHMQAESLLGLFESEKVTITAGVPTVLLQLLEALDADPDRFQLSLRLVLAGGSAISRSLVRSFDERHGIPVLHSWGMTELSPLGSTAVPPPGSEAWSKDEHYAYATKQGLPVPFVEIRGSHEGGAIPWDGQTIGELEVRGPWVASGYYRAEGVDEKMTADGWFRTGDIVSIGPEGCIEVRDRSNDFIKSGGEWISSQALENALMDHPAVAEAAVIAVPDAKWGERPFACVALREGKSVSGEALKAFLSGTFAGFWIPEGYAFIDAIPRTSVGKFMKSALRERYGREH